MKKSFCSLLALVCLAGMSLSARAVTPAAVSGTVLSSQGVLQPNASVVFTIMNCAAGSPPTYNGATQPSGYSFAAGANAAISGTVPDTADISCSSTVYYKVVAKTSTGVEVWSRNYYVTGSSFDLNTASQLAVLPPKPSGGTTTSSNIAKTSAMLKGDTNGNAMPAVPGVDFVAPGVSSHVSIADTATLATTATNADHAVTADTATHAQSFPVTPSPCSNGQLAGGIDSSGNAINCADGGGATLPATPSLVFATSASASRAATNKDVMDAVNQPFYPAICNKGGALFTAAGCINFNINDDGSTGSPTPGNLTGLMYNYNAWGASGAGNAEARTTQVHGDYGVLATPGIKQLDQSTISAYGIGDVIFMNWNHNCHAGVAYQSDQGCQLIYNYGGQGGSGGHYNGFVPTGQGGTGVTTMALPNGFGCNDPLNQHCVPPPGVPLLGGQTAAGRFTAGPVPSGTIPWLYQIATNQTTLPTATAYGYSTAVSINPNTHSDTQIPVTVTLTAGAGTLAVNDIVCAMGDQFYEQSKITAVSGALPTETVTLGLTRPEAKIAIFQGGCHYVQLAASGALGDWSVYPAVSIDGVNWIHGVPQYSAFGGSFPSTGNTPETYDGTASAAWNSFCGARVLRLDGVQDPITTHLEPNACVWADGGMVQAPDFPVQKVNGIVNTAVQNEPSVSNGSLEGIITSIDGMGASGSAIGIHNNNFFSRGCASYAVGSCGGRLSAPTAMYNGGVWGNWAAGDYAPAYNLFYFNQHLPGQTTFNILTDPWGVMSLDPGGFHFTKDVFGGSYYSIGLLSSTIGVIGGAGDGAGNHAGVEFPFPTGGPSASTYLTQCNLNPFTLVGTDLCVSSQGASRSAFNLVADRGLQVYYLTMAGDSLGQNSTINFGSNYHRDAIDLYHSGSNIYGIGINDAEFQMYAHGDSHYVWNVGDGGLHASGEGEVMRLDPTNALILPSTLKLAFTNSGVSAGTIDTYLSKLSPGVAGINGSTICTAGNAASTPGCGGGSSASSETVAFSATPTFSTSTSVSVITLTGSVTSFTLGAGTDGQTKTLMFCQDATGNHTVTAPDNVHGFLSSVGMTASKCSVQTYFYNTASSIWFATTPGVINE